MAKRFQRLTRPAIRALTAGQALTEGGITAERTKDGDVRYTVSIMVDRRRIHRVVGLASDGVGREQAEDLIAKFRTLAREDRLELPKGRKTKLCFTEAASQYIEKLRASGGKQIPRKEQQLVSRLVPVFGRTSLASISRASIEEFAAARIEQGAKPSSVNRELATLSHLFGKAVEWKWITKSAVPTIPRMKEPEGRIIALTETQCEALLAAALADSDPDLWLFVIVALHTSMRHGELRRLTWDLFDAERRRFNIPIAKSGMREQPLTSGVTAVLSAEMKRRGVSSGPLFPPGPGSKTAHRHTFRKAFRRAVVAAGLDTVITPHVTRHTSITALIKKGVDLPTVQKFSGHKTMSQVLRYAHVHANHIDESVDRLEMPVLVKLQRKVA